MNKKNIIMISCSIVYMDARVKSYISALNNEGYNVDVVSLKENKYDKMKIKEDGYVNYRVAARYIGSSLPSYLLYYLVFTLKALLVVSYLSFVKRIAVIHYNNLPNFPIFASVIPKLLGANIILDNHDLITVMFASKFASGKENGFINYILLREQILSMRFANNVITADHNQRDFLLRAGIAPKKITVIMNVANDKWFRPEKRGRTDKEFRLIYHGTISERLGLDVAVEAVNIATILVPNLKFNLIGKGDYLDYCEKLIKYHGLEDEIFLSKCFYPVEKLSEIINKMDIGIIPNKRTIAADGFMLPVKLLEYVYMNKPVIAPRLKIIERYFDDTMIKYFEPGNVEDLARCILELYQNPEERDELVKNASTFIKKYNWKNQEKEYLKLIL